MPAKYALKKSKAIKIFCLILVNVVDHAELFILIALLNGFTSKLKKKLLEVHCTLILINLNVRFVSPNSQ